VDEKGSEYILAHTGPRELDGHPLGGGGLGFGLVLLCFIDPRVRKIRNEASSCPVIFSRTLRFYNVASSPSSPSSRLYYSFDKGPTYNSVP